MNRTSTLKCSVLAIVATAVLAGTAQAAPTWLDPALPFGEVASRPNVADAAMAPDGTVVIARFAPDGALEVRERPPGGPIGPTTTIPPVTAAPSANPRLQVLVGPDGAAAVTFDAGTIRYASLRPPGGTWNTPVEASTAGVGRQATALGAGGVLWSVGGSVTQGGALDVYRLAADGSRATIPLPRPPAGGLDSEPGLSLTPDGEAHLVYQEDLTTAVGAACTRVSSVRATTVATSTAAPAAVLDERTSTGTGSASACTLTTGEVMLGGALAIAVGDDGSDTATYTVLTVPSFSTLTRARHRAAGASWPAAASSPEVVSDLPNVTPLTLLAGAGAPVLLAQTFIAGSLEKSVSVRSPDGAWSPMTSVTGPRGDTVLAAARGARGITVFAWQDGQGDHGMRGRIMGVDGTLDQIRPLPGAPLSGYRALAAGVDAQGNAVALYQGKALDGSQRLALNGYDAAGPELSITAAPGPDGTPRAARLSVSGVDVWSGPITTATWDFGDGSTGSGLVVDHAFAAGGGHTVTAAATDPLGNATTLSRQVTVADPAVPPGPGTPPGTGTGTGTPPRDARAPSVGRVTVTPGRPTARRAPALVFTTDEGGRLIVSLARTARGVRAGGRCIAPGPRVRRGGRCTRTLAQRSVARTVTAGRQRLRLPRLARGTWTATVIVTDAAGNGSRARRTTFQVR